MVMYNSEYVWTHIDMRLMLEYGHVQQWVCVDSYPICRPNSHYIITLIIVTCLTIPNNLIVGPNGVFYILQFFSSNDHPESLKKRKPSSSPSPIVFPLMQSAQGTSSRTRRSNAYHEYPDRPQSPLVGKMVRRLLKPRRIQNPPTTEDSDSDMDSVWPNWDRESIASEIRCAEDCNGPVY